MAKIRGVKRWRRTDVFIELMALEIKLDSLHQKALRYGKVELTEKDVSWMLGAVRSILGKVGQPQKTLKRWIRPAPNQRLRKEASK